MSTRCLNFSGTGGFALTLLKVLPNDSAVFSETDRVRSGGVGIEVEGTTGGGKDGGGKEVPIGGVGETKGGGASGTTIDSEIGCTVCRVVNGLGLAGAGRVGLGSSSETGDPCEPCRGDDGLEGGSLCIPDKRPARGRRDMCGWDPGIVSTTTGEDVPNADKFGGTDELVCSMSDAWMTSVMSGRASFEGGAGAGSNA